MSKSLAATQLPETNAACARNWAAGTPPSIGNGRNDIQVFPASVLSIAVIGNEGAFTKSAMLADVLVNDVCQALELLLSPNRLIATLRE